MILPQFYDKFSTSYELTKQMKTLTQVVYLK
jgi:hypothetical protein